MKAPPVKHTKEVTLKGVKMKKSLVAIVVVILLAIGSWYYLKPHHVRAIPADLLPHDTLLLVDFIDLEKGIDDFKKGKFGQKLKEIDLAKVMLELEVSKDVIEKYKNIELSVFSAIDSLLFKELFGQETAIAVLPIKIDHPKLKELKKALRSIVFISRPKHNADFTEFITRYLAKGSEGQVEVYGDYEIKNLNLDNDLSIYYSLVDGLLIASFDSLSIKNCIHFKANQKESLAENKNYQDLRHNLVSKSIRSFVYHNTEKFCDYMLIIARSINPAGMKCFDIERSLDPFNGIKAVGYAAYDDGSDLLHDKTLVLFDKCKMEPDYAKSYSFKPGENKTIQMVPEDTICYYWTNTMDTEFLFNIFSEKMFPDDKIRESKEAEFQKEFGSSLDEIFQALGNQFGIILTEIDMGSPIPIPIPKLTILFEVKNRKTLEELFESAIQKEGIGLEKEKIEDVEINTIVLPAVIDIQPSYVFYKGFCMVSIDRQMIKDMINVSNNGQGIISNVDFQNVNKGLTGKNNDIVFIKFDDLIDEIKELWEWEFSNIASKDQDTGTKCKIIADGVIYPFLDGLKMYKTIGSYSIMKENEIVSETYLKIDR
ncbi:MAG: hypothetical protein DRP37_02075 [Thermodesulfobacteriota bacterium]|nr:MAG: hypothetical protein DRP37_02075 [Thermodesulfobacteriota bacterium]